MLAYFKVLIKTSWYIIWNKFDIFDLIFAGVFGS